MLGKQWIAEYPEGLSLDPKHSSAERLRREARFREFRFSGLLRWHVPQIIGALPIVLHVALLLFGVGLVDFFWNLDRITSVIIIVFAVIITTVYMGFTITPALSPDCPYRTPLSHLLANIIRAIRVIFSPQLQRELKDKLPQRSDPLYVEKLDIQKGGALFENEKQEVERESKSLDARFLLRAKEFTRNDSLAAWADDELKMIETNEQARRMRPIEEEDTPRPQANHAAPKDSRAPLQLVPRRHDKPLRSSARASTHGPTPLRMSSAPPIQGLELDIGATEGNQA
jgi:hypothetical protein